MGDGDVAKPFRLSRAVNCPALLTAVYSRDKVANPMSYQVIARKWRPQAFAEVTGQEPITRTLINALEHDRLHHAYLFSGARGVGKTTTARLLAKALNCHKTEGPTATPCAADDPDACVSCREIGESHSIDVIEIDAASHTKVEEVREVILAGIAFAPARDRNKVFIIDEVHMLSGSSFNALLKTLEEPPSWVKFIMATTETHKIPDTILSRCQQFEFRTIATAKIADRLRLIASAEKIEIDEPALKEIARAGEGSMRDAQSAFDQVISFSGNKIGVDDVSAALGLAGTEMLDRVVQGIADQQPAAALAVVEDLVMRGHDLRNFCRDLLGHFRDLLVAKVAGDNSSLLESSVFDPAKLKVQGAKFSESDLVRFFHSLAQTEAGLRTAAHPRFLLEIGLVKLMEMQRITPLASIIERLAALENGGASGPSGSSPSSASGSGSPSGGTTSTPRTSGGSGGSISGATSAGSGARTAGDSGAKAAVPAPPPPSSPKPATTAQRATKASPADDLPFGGVGGTATAPKMETPAAGANPVAPPPAAHAPAAEPAASSTRSLGTEMERICDYLESKKKALIVTALSSACSVDFTDDEIVIAYEPEMASMKSMISKPDSILALREACREILGRTPGLSIITIEPDAGAPLTRQQEEAREKQRMRELVEQNPALQNVLRIFQGEIVDVRPANT